MACKLRISGVVEESIVDGPGLRYVVFTQGCPHHCKGCHNPQTHDFDGGREIDISEILCSIDENPLLCGVTFSGGEPFAQCRGLVLLAQEVKKRGKNIFCYTGYTLEQLLEKGKQEPLVLDLLRLCDTLVDGPYLEEQRDLTLQYRGSSNQRLIDLKQLAI